MRRSLLVIAAVAACVSLLAACGGDGAGSGGSSTGGPGAKTGARKLRIEFAMIGSTGDSFWNVVRNGGVQAGKDLGVDVTYHSTDKIDFVDQARLIRASIARKPDGLIVTDHEPKVLDGAIQEAVKAGIPVIITNAGHDEVAKTGALTYVGQDEYQVGVLAGERLKQAGLKSLFCINQSVGAVNLDQRCSGLRKGFGGPVKVLGVDDADRTASRNRIKAALRSGGVDGMLALGQTSAEPALQALDESGKAQSVKLATIDLSPTILTALKERKLLFASDQQQYLQGYLPVQTLVLYLRYGLRPQGDVSTGPSYVTPDTAQQVIDLTKRGIR
ncbi:MAG TPA: sugar ABC transporter substrate-binding protein [Solirubrobacteraceae bacterium]